MRPLVVWHTERVDNPNRFIVGLLRYRPAVTVHDGTHIHVISAAASRRLA